jgi:hypothetical protein
LLTWYEYIILVLIDIKIKKLDYKNIILCQLDAPTCQIGVGLAHLITTALLPRHLGGTGALLDELRVTFRGVHGVNHAMVDQWLSCAVELPLLSGELHLYLCVG